MADHPVGAARDEVARSDGSEQDRRGQSVTEEFDLQRSLRDITQHSRHDGAAIERCAVRGHGATATRSTRDVRPGARGHLLAGTSFQLVEVGRHHRCATVDSR